MAAGYRRAAKRVTGMESLFDRDGRLQVTAPSVRYFKIGNISGRTEVGCGRMCLAPDTATYVLEW